MDRDSTVTFAYVNGQGKAGDPARVECRRFSQPKDLGVLVRGLKAEYFEGEWRTVPKFDDLTTAKAEVVQRIGVDFSGREENFGLRYMGYIEIPRDGLYRFSVLSDDGSVLWLAGAKVVDNDGLHAPQEKSASIWLRAGLYPLELGFFQLGGARSLEAYVEGPALPRTPLAEMSVVRRGS